MKKVILTIINFIASPWLFFLFLYKARKFKNVKFSRLQYSLFTAHYTMYREATIIKLKEIYFVGLIFELDYIIDQVIKVNNPNYYEEMINLLNTHGAMSEFLKLFNEEDEKILKSLIIDSFKVSYDLDRKESFGNINEYLDMASITIVIYPMYLIYLRYLGIKDIDNEYSRLASDIMRIVNDGSSYLKDKEETGTKNIYLSFDKEEVDKLLKEKINSFNSHDPQNKAEIFLHKLINL